MDIFALLYTRMNGFDLFFSNYICFYLIANLHISSNITLRMHKFIVCIMLASRLGDMVRGKVRINISRLK